MGEGDLAKITVKYNQDNHVLHISLQKTLKDLKDMVYEKTKLDPPLQKLMFKGELRGDTKTLEELKIRKRRTRILLVGSSLDDIMEVNAGPDAAKKSAKSNNSNSSSSSSDDELWCAKKEHDKIVKLGPPLQSTKGLKDKNLPMPSDGMLHGIRDKNGTPVRLIFKSRIEQLWISTKTGSTKIHYQQIRDVKSQAIKGSEEYHIVSLIIKQTKYFLYYVPAQYVRAVRIAILGFSYADLL